MTDQDFLDLFKSPKPSGDGYVAHCPAHPDRKRSLSIAIRDGRIAALGSNTEIAALKVAGTRVIDAAGNSVVPGFIEAHMHLFGGCAVVVSARLSHDWAGEHGNQGGCG